MGKLVFDSGSFSIRKAGSDVTRLVWKVVRYVALTLSLTILTYAVLAAFISTDTERALRSENRMYAEVCPELEAKSAMIRDVVAGLQRRDDAIYGDIFHTEAPNPDPMGSLDFLFGSDTIPDTKILKYTDSKAGKLVSDASEIDAAFERILLKLAKADSPIPPMEMPVDGISYVQVGASTGSKISPFLKTSVRHNGLDVIAPQGAPIHAPAAGSVVGVERSMKGEGNTVVISHAGGYETRFCHLSEISVSKGQNVRAGQKIGTVGMTGSAYAPHLHYEVRKDGTLMNPVGYLFASVGPEDWANFLYMSEKTEQSMD